MVAIIQWNFSDLKYFSIRFQGLLGGFCLVTIFIQRTAVSLWANCQFVFIHFHCIEFFRRIFGSLPTNGSRSSSILVYFIYYILGRELRLSYDKYGLLFIEESFCARYRGWRDKVFGRLPKSFHHSGHGRFVAALYNLFVWNVNEFL